MTGRLRLVTAGSVDDGKSTLIGRLLYDARALLADELANVEETSRRRNGDGPLELALVTDGLRIERDQNITIDVAYRPFATPRRRFLLADSPGHAQYTRNMITGASTADVAVILVDAGRGMTEQSCRHAAIARLLELSHVTVCVNKMDLVDWSLEVFEALVSGFRAWSAGLGLRDVTFIPVSALHGDNVVERSARMDWYSGPPLLEHLETVPVGARAAAGPLRLPVQYVIRGPHRRYAGQLAAGRVAPGEEIVVLPTGRTSRIATVEGPAGELELACAPLSITAALVDDLDVARGDLIAASAGAPEPVREFDATLCWLGDTPARLGARYLLKHTSRTVPARLEAIHHRLDVCSGGTEPAHELAMNDIARVRVRTGAEIVADPYRENRLTGAVILIDPHSNDTVGAAMVA
jgi:sulfate adenylyltransferase subunit 1